MNNYWKYKLEENRKKNQVNNSTINNESFEKLKNQLSEWEKNILEPWVNKSNQSTNQNTTFDDEIKTIYTPLDSADYSNQYFPGSYPFTRGPYPDMYRGKKWTMRMFSGFGTPNDTNKRLKYLVKQGQTGLSIAFDMPTLYGYDADNERCAGEVGKCGCNISSLKDMEILLDGIPLDKVSTSMTINAPASVLTAMYATVAKKNNIQINTLRGTVQTDILKEYIAQKEWAYPPDAHMRIIKDMMEYCTKEMPNWNYISISGYHIREAGSNAVQELAFTLANGFTYLELGQQAGLKIEKFAPRLSFFFNCCMNFCEEIAKFRAARRIWATVLKEKYGVKDKRSLLLRFHTQTSGASLTWQQPMNNIIRTTIEALAGVLGGTQSLHTNSYDEAWALPTEDAVKIALRTQQIIAEETGVTATADPLGGSYYIEWLTDKMEEQAYQYFDKIDSMGGVVNAIKNGYLQKEIAETAYKTQLKIEKDQDIIVGVNKYNEKEDKPIDTLRVDLKAQEIQIKRLKKIKNERNNNKVKESLERLRKAYSNENENCMYPTIEAVNSYATLQEIIDIGRDVFGEWTEPSIF
ncbi:MAG: methylmalonyl-CoA mutase [Thaumarchaeota archaeon]|nr:methylmalonyl-CoA mutase [Nitrososphaerota archaeon]